MLAVVSALVVLPACASANTNISYSGSLNRLLVNTDGGESNFVSASQNGNTYTFVDEGFNDTTFNSIPITESSTQCTKIVAIPVDRVECTVANLSYVEVNLGSGEFDGFDASDPVNDGLYKFSTTANVDGGLGDDYVLTGTGDDTLLGSVGDDDLEGDEGNDTIESGDDDDSYLDGGPGNDTIDSGNGADYLTGSEGDDVLIGDGGDDSYEGSDGDDVFVALSAADGADTIDDFGDGGTDTADFSARGAAAVALSNNDEFDDGAVALSGEDGLGNLDEIGSDVEVLVGGAGDDTLAGYGLPGGIPNVLRGGPGNDTLIGTDGSNADIADYSNSPLAVTVDLAAGSANGGAGSDTLNAIEGAYGSSSADTLTGSSADNLLRGNLGNDTLNGAGGTDTADYANSTGAVTLDLSTANPHNTGAAGSDTISSIESANGGAGNDTLTGDSTANALAGNAGNDTLTGNAGSDSASGGAGADDLQVRDDEDDSPLTCGDGSDSVTADGLPLDPTGLDCESVDRSSGPPPAAPSVAGTTPSSPSNDPSPRVSGSAEAGTTVDIYTNATCSGSPVATGTAAAYASPGLQVSPALSPDGTYTFRAAATNANGTSACSSGAGGSATYVLDTTPPDTSITAGPANGSSTNDSTPTFSFTSPDGTATFECRVDAGSFATCGNPFTTTTIGDGPHTFEVRAKDPAGNVDPSPASRSFTIDTVAPDTSITGGPAAGSTTADNTPTLTFSSPDGTATFECKVDAGAFAACTSPFTTTALSDGLHTVDVRAKDPAGNTDASPASRSFTVDTTPPDTSVTAGLANGSSTNDSTPTFSFSSPDGTATFQCRIDGGAWNPCTSPFTLPALGDGAHTFEVRAIDPVGNADPSPVLRSFTVDTSVPDTSITAGPADGSTITDSTPTFSFSSPEAGASFECRVDGGSYASCSSPRTLSALGDGPHTFDVRAKDAAGNTDASPASRSFTVDATAPDTSITGGPADGSTINDDTPTFTFSSPDGSATFECSIDGAPFAACTSPHTTAALTDASHTFRVRAKDTIGNTDPSPAQVSFTVLASLSESKVFGYTLSLTGNPDPAKRKLNVKARDLQIGIGGGNLSVDDPTLQGATLRVAGTSPGEFDVTYNLPAANWIPIGPIGANKGYKYKDKLRAAGPITTAMLKPGAPGKNGQLQFVGSGSALVHTLATNPGGVVMAATLGSQRFCAQYGGLVNYKANVYFKAKQAPAPASCP